MTVLRAISEIAWSILNREKIQFLLLDITAFEKHDCDARSIKVRFLAPPFYEHLARKVSKRMKFKIFPIFVETPTVVPNNMRKIILLIDCASEYDRRLLRGLVRYSKEHGPWEFYRMPVSQMGIRDDGLHVIQWAKKWKADAIIGRWRWSNTSSLVDLNIPIVLQNYAARSSRFSNLTGDYIGTGAKVSRFFIERKFRNFAYFGVKDVVWSEERWQGYEVEVERYGGQLHQLMVDDPYKERDRVVDWLHSLPKPIALFACDDAYALFMTEVCNVEGISIPEEVSLIGVDNDDLLCQISSPQITSIELNVEQGGYHLGEMLERQFESNSVWSFNVVISPGEIIERGSTLKHNIKDACVDKLVKYIDDNFDQYITTDQILSQVPLSRRSLETRFKNEMNSTTIYKYLTTCRMNKFANLLATTDLPMTDIADRCGLLNYPNISRAFKRIYHCTPKEYRQNQKKDKIH